MEDASGRRLYVCLRCGNKFWSRAKKPQCSVCKSKRVIPYEEFLKLPEEERERILGKRSEEKEEEQAKEVTAKVEESGNEAKSEKSERVKPVENREKEVKREESPKVPRAHQSEKQGEKVKGERVKREISIPKPRLSWKAVGVVLGLAFLWYLYKTGWFDSVLEFLGVKEKEEPVKAYEERRSPLLGKIESNLRR